MKNIVGKIKRYKYFFFFLNAPAPPDSPLFPLPAPFPIKFRNSAWKAPLQSRRLFKGFRRRRKPLGKLCRRTSRSRAPQAILYPPCQSACGALDIRL